MQWTAIVNPAAGRGRTRRALAGLRDELAKRGVTVRVTTTIADGVDAARHAIADGQGVLAVGGDGTVAGLLEPVVSAGGILGIVPLGSGNDFARHLGFDHRRPERALALLEQGAVRAVDLGRATTADGREHLVTTVAHAGFDGAANAWANGVHRFGGPPLYAAAVLRTLLHYRPQATEVTVDGDTWSGRAWLVAIANTDVYGGGMRIAPAARADDATLEVCIVGAVSRGRFVMSFPRVYRGTHTRIHGVELRRGTTVELRAPGTALDLSAAGERLGPLPARVTIAPGALQVLAPPMATRR